MSVLVTDGAERASLAVTRCLGARGIDVAVGEGYKYCTASLSKYCKEHVTYPLPDSDCHKFIEGLLNIVEKKNYEAIYTIREITTILVSYYKKELEKYIRVPVPDYETMMMVHDKARTLKFALDYGIPCPTTYFVEGIDEVENLSGGISYPVVIKPRCKTIWNGNKPRMLKVTSKNYVHNKEELVNKFQAVYRASGVPPLIQEYIPGEGYGVEVLLNHGEPRALFMHRRLREYPITGGASTFRESIYDEKLRDISLKLLKGLQWHGVAMVEFKVDERDKVPKLMEINGRFWGSLALSVASGVDFPYLLHKMVTDGDIKPVFDYKIGVKCRWLIPGDTLWLLASLRNGKNKTDAVREFFQFGGTHYDILSKKDFLPTVGATRVVLHQIMDVLSGKRNLDGEMNR